MQKKVLMVAFHYPPFQGSSGVQRTLNFSRYLLESEWEPVIITAHPRSYQGVSDNQLSDIPENIDVKRVFAIDTAKHLSVGGRYPGFLAWPDRWVSWWIPSVVAGLRLIRRLKPRIIWTTYPIATSHLIGLTLHRLTGLPWIADFRDSMTESNYPPDPRIRKIYRWLERRVVENATHIVFTAPSTKRMYIERYPNIPESSWSCILNGFDEDSFLRAESAVARKKSLKQNRIVLIHSGLLYPSERDPKAFFIAISELKRTLQISAKDLCIKLRGTGYDELWKTMIAEYDIADIVSLAPTIGYTEALEEMLQTDGLILLQATSCNHQIPAKLYEYLRARKPILGLTDPEGDTASLIRYCGISSVVPLNDKDAIKIELMKFLKRIHDNSFPTISDEIISSYSRRSQTKELANLFNSIISESA